MYKLKPIKPKGRSSDFSRLPGAVKRGMRDAAEAVKKDFEKTTQGWKHDVEFTIEEVGDYDLTVSTDDEIWRYQDEGTGVAAGKGKYDIFPKRKRALFWPGARHPVRRVKHPGVKAQHFTQKIAKRWRKGVAPFIRAAIEEAIG